jgi:hypothetical protein
MNFNLKRLILCGAFTLGAISGGVVIASQSRNPDQKTADAKLMPRAIATDSGMRSKQVEISTTYASVTRDEMLSKADAIFVGRVAEITPALWNQNSGEYWEDADDSALPYHQVKLDVLNPLVNTKKGQQVVVTVLGSGPVGELWAKEQQVIGTADYRFQVGTKGVFFVKKGQIGWLEPTGKTQLRPVLAFMGSPTLSYLVEKNGVFLSEDSSEPPYPLEYLIARLKAMGRQIVHRE